MVSCNYVWNGLFWTFRDCNCPGGCITCPPPTDEGTFIGQIESTQCTPP